jgi:hypothetical protein
VTLSSQVDVYQIAWFYILEERNFHLIGFEFFIVCLSLCYMQFFDNLYHTWL